MIIIIINGNKNSDETKNNYFRIFYHNVGSDRACSIFYCYYDLICSIPYYAFDYKTSFSSYDFFLLFLLFLLLLLNKTITTCIAIIIAITIIIKKRITES